jgi:hypothetical protein
MGHNLKVLTSLRADKTVRLPAVCRLTHKKNAFIAMLRTKTLTRRPKKTRIFQSERENRPITKVDGGQGDQIQFHYFSYFPPGRQKREQRS